MGESQGGDAPRSTLLLPYCLTALLPYCLIALLPYCLIALLPDCPDRPSCYALPTA